MIFQQATERLRDALEMWRISPAGGPGAGPAAREVNSAHRALLDLEVCVAAWWGATKIREQLR